MNVLTSCMNERGMMMSEIKDCPWCGSKALATGHNTGIRVWVVCTVYEDCYSSGPAKPTEAEAIAAWNEVAGLKELAFDKAKECPAWFMSQCVKVTSECKVGHVQFLDNPHPFPEAEADRVKEKVKAVDEQTRPVKEGWLKDSLQQESEILQSFLDDEDREGTGLPMRGTKRSFCGPECWGTNDCPLCKVDTREEP